MKSIKKKIILIVLSVLIILAGIFGAKLKATFDKRVDGKWELAGICEDYNLRFGNFGEYEYFSMFLSKDGIINIFSYPEIYAGLGTYSFIEKKNNTYIYMANLFITDNGEVERFGAKISYNTEDDILFLFFSEDDGLFFERTEEMTTVKISEPKENPQDYIGRYGTGDYNEYEDFYECEVVIKDITDTEVIFDVFHYRLWGEDGVVATKNAQGYYYFEVSDFLCCGYILFENDSVIIDITKADGNLITLGKTTYHRVNDKIEVETTEKYVDMNDYKSSCERSVLSKNLVRFEQDYLNKNFCYKGVIFEAYSDNVYKIMTDENGDCIYGDNIIYAEDCRINDNTKILENDTMTIYCTFVGVTENDIPCFEFYYADIEGVQ